MYMCLCMYVYVCIHGTCVPVCISIYLSGYLSIYIMSMKQNCSGLECKIKSAGLAVV